MDKQKQTNMASARLLIESEKIAQATELMSFQSD